uniref:Uncharacterized protein n=1 Tax=Ditylum brightwellii TaxID=49249 RepID=A0A7S4W3Q3_9STRA
MPPFLITNLILFSINFLMSTAVKSTATCPRTIFTKSSDDSNNNIRLLVMSDHSNTICLIFNSNIMGCLLKTNIKLFPTKFTSFSLESNPANSLCFTFMRCNTSNFLGNLKTCGCDLARKRGRKICIRFGVQCVKNRWFILKMCGKFNLITCKGIFCFPFCISSM